MKLQGRDLNEGMQGADVRLLHFELGLLGMEIPHTEMRENHFGEHTRELVERFQAKFGIEGTGIVDSVVAERINAAIHRRMRPDEVLNRLTEETAAALERIRSLNPKAHDLRTQIERCSETLQAFGFMLEDLRRLEEDERLVSRIAEMLRSGNALLDRFAESIEDEKEKPAGKPLEKIRINGYLRDEDGMPVAGIRVQAFHKGFRVEIPLEHAVTKPNGHFEILISPKEKFQKRKQLNLFVRAFDKRGREIATSAENTLFNASNDETINLVLGNKEYREAPEVIDLQLRLHPVIGEVAAGAITSDDISVLAAETGVNAEQIELLAQSERLAQQTDIPREVFYAMGRQGLPTELNSLLRHRPDEWRQSLQQALSDRIVLKKHIPSVEEVSERLLDLAVDRQLNDENGLGALLRTNSILRNNTSAQRAFVRTQLEQDLPAEAFWRSLSQCSEFDRGEVLDAAQRVAQLSATTGSYLPLIQRLEAELPQEEGLSAIKRLAALSEDEWKERVLAAGPPEDMDPTDYAQLLYRRIEETFPTEVVKNLLKNEPEDLPGRDHVLAFLENNPEFDFEKSSIRNFIDSPDDINGLADVQRWERVFNIAPIHGRYEVVRTLLKNGVDSAHSVIQEGPNFRRKLSKLIGEEGANTVWENSRKISAMALTVFSNYSGAFNNLPVHAIPSLTPEELHDVANGDPTLTNLFGSQDYCECEHCKSIYGPAAYFVDLLQFLKKASKKNGRSPLSILLDRRPALVEIELSCSNTNTSLPYVDLVNEVLENAASRFHLIEYRRSLNDCNLDDENQIREKFRTARHPLSSDASMSTVEFGQRWRIEDGEKVYILFNKQGHVYATPLLRNQTLGQEEELSVQPEHIKAKAYAALKEAKYPWTLPFDLRFEEAKIYLTHLGFERHIWMDKLVDRQPGYFDQYKVACDHLGLTDVERRLILGGGLWPEPELWGMNQQDWPQALRSAPVFLRQAGFDMKNSSQGFRLLRQLLVGTRYINQNRTVKVPLPGVCELNEVRITTGMDDDWESILNKARRFLRLQRKIGWTTPELDKAISAFGGHLDRDLLKNLSFVERLRKRTGVPLLELLSWWGDMDTDEDLAEEEEDKKEISFYEQLFLDKSVDNPTKEIFALNQDGTELANHSGKITENASAVIAALEINMAALERLVGKDQQADDPLHQNNAEIPDELNLNNLSKLHRHVSLARALKLSIRELLAAKALLGEDPFASPAETLNFIRAMDKIKASDFNVLELNYLLRHRHERTDNVAPTPGELASRLQNIHTGLIKIAEDTSDAPNPDAEAVTGRLGEVLDPESASEVIAILQGLVEYQVSLPALQNTFEIPTDLKGRIRHNAEAQKLFCKGLMSSDEKVRLLGLSGDDDYQIAVEDLFNQPRIFAGDTLHLLFDSQQGVLQFLEDTAIGIEEKLRELLSRSNTHLRRKLSHNLIKQELTTSLELNADIASLLLEEFVEGRVDGQGTALHDLLTLKKGGLSARYFANDSFQGPAVKRTDTDLNLDWSESVPPVNPGPFSVRWQGMIQAEKSGTYTFHIQTKGNAALLINDRLLIDARDQDPQPPGEKDKKSVIELEAGKFYRFQVDYDATDASGHIKVLWTPPSMEAQQEKQQIPSGRWIPADVLKTYQLLYKLALIINGFDIQADELQYLVSHGHDFQNFDVNKFPVESSEAHPNLFKQFTHLHDLFSFRDKYSGSQTRMIDVLGAAHQQNDEQSIKEARKQLCALTGWDESQLEVITGSEALPGIRGFEFKAEDFRDGKLFLELYHAFRLLRQLGITAEQLLGWVNKDIPELAEEIKQVVKAKYGKKQWLAVARPLRDGLRRKQRSSLVDYLVHGYGLKGPYDLYAHFLIDVEMEPCMMTSRLKQAISSVQLFVQRALFNLEPDVDFSPEDASEWEWRKNYRVWEANRKVFATPENWIFPEPVFRDDSTPFYEELYSELLQNELTTENVEAAFRNYLHKLDEVARLEIVGMYVQEEGWYEERERRTVDNVLHVFGRTPNDPHVYYYRRWIDEAYWTPWERVDLDIEGEHLIPVVWNRRLYLFWPIFKEKKQRFSDESTDEESTVSYWEIQFAWSQYLSGNWSCKTKAISSVDATWIAKTLDNQKTKGYECYVYRNQEKELWKNGISSWIKYGSNFYQFPGLFIFRTRRMNAEHQLSIRSYVSTNKHTDFYWPIAEFYINVKGMTTKVEEKLTKADIMPILKFQNQSRNSPNNMFFTQYINEKFDLFYLPIFEDKASPGDLTIYEKMTFIRNSLEQKKVLEGLSKRFIKVLPPARDGQFDAGKMPFFYQDDERTFLVKCYAYNSGIGMGGGVNTCSTIAYNKELTCSFYMFYHPHASKFIKQINWYGIEGLLDPKPLQDGYTNRRQMAFIPADKKEFFKDEYGPVRVNTPFPKEDVEFDYRGAYSIYNWEVFYHIPSLISSLYRQNQHYEESIRWFHFIFDPTYVPIEPQKEPSPQRYWKVRPFYEAQSQSLQRFMFLLNEGDEEFENQVDQWEKQPFKPHKIARLRTSAYMGTVVIKYLDNVIAWADQLFRRDSIESINEATQLYILASQILGPRPQSIPAQRHKPRTYQQLENGEKDFDELSNILVQVENLLAGNASQLPSAIKENQLGSSRRDYFENPDQEAGPDLAHPERKRHPFGRLPIGREILYFCIPPNEKLRGYWDIVDDRLFKIRHCMNIKGVVRDLPLFQPPIDPALLVRAAAAGLDIGSVLDDLYAPLPHNRFQVMIQKATELCSEVRSLGAALLSALEKKDAEGLALLRSKNQISLLQTVKEVKKLQIKDSEESLESLQKVLELLTSRKNYYEGLDEKGLNANEKLNLKKLKSAHNSQNMSRMYNLAATIAHGFPTVTYTESTTEYSVSTAYGGSHMGRIAEAFGKVFGMIAAADSAEATTASIKAGQDRRSEEWRHQIAMTTIEKQEIEKKIVSAEICQEIAEKELSNHEQKIENAKSMDDYMHQKFTNQQLYNWMVTQISTLYFQSYNLAYDLAKQAERSYQFETGISDSDFIQFGYWDSLKKGLLAGERLHYDLNRMEAAFIENNQREFEITKHISLAILNPEALETLRASGQAYFGIPELLFDLDFRGHCMRRIKSVSLTIPCVTGPYTSISCIMTLLSNRIRNCGAGVKEEHEGYYWKGDTDDNRFIYDIGGTESIATSSGQNDNGMFELNFQDERYLPFEGRGAISKWRLELPGKFRQFDYNTISDVILHLKYTARDGGPTLRNSCEEAVKKALTQTGSLFCMISARQEFPGEWHDFFKLVKESAEEGDVYKHRINFQLSPDRLPYAFRDAGAGLRIDDMTLLMRLKAEEDVGVSLEYHLKSSDAGFQVQERDGQIPKFNVFHTDDGIMAKRLLIANPFTKNDNVELNSPQSWTLEIEGGNTAGLPVNLRRDVPVGGVNVHGLNPEAIEDLVILCRYAIK